MWCMGLVVLDKSRDFVMGGGCSVGVYERRIYGLGMVTGQGAGGGGSILPFSYCSSLVLASINLYAIAN